MNAEQLAFGGMGTTVNNNFSAFQNPSLLVFTNAPSLGLSVENKFLTKELQSYLFQGSVNLHSSGCIGIFGARTGNTNFSENEIGIIYSRKLTEKFSVGINFSHQELRLNTGEYSSPNEWTAAIGMSAKPLSFLEIGVVLFNPAHFQRTNKKVNVAVPQLNIGTAWAISKNVKVRLETEQKSPGTIALITALEYKPNDLLCLRMGYRTSAAQPAFGFGIKMKAMKIDAGCMYHNVLGFSPGVSISYSL